MIQQLQSWPTPEIFATSSGGGGSFDPDAVDFFVRAGITDPVQKDAINTLVMDLKAFDLWTRGRAFYPFVGGTAASHAENLFDSNSQITWTGAITHDANGVTGNGGYGDTNLQASSGFINNVCFGVYSRTDINDNFYDVGAGLNGAAFPNVLGVSCAWSDGQFYGDNSGNDEIGNVYGNTLGSFTDSRWSSSEHFITANGVQQNISSAPQGSFGAANFFIMVLAADYLPTSTRNYGAAWIYLGLLDDEVVNLHTIVNNYQTALGRNVV